MVFRLPVCGTTSVEEARSLHDGERVADKSGYIHSDLRSSVVAKTAYSGPAQLDREAEYGAWGETRSVSSNPAPTHQFVDTEPDSATGYYYFGARVYDPSLKRWLSPDPLMWSKPEVEAKDGRELNLYSYVKNNPVRHTDPKGLTPTGPDSVEDWIGVFFGVGGSQRPQAKMGTVELPGSRLIKGARFLRWPKHAQKAARAAQAEKVMDDIRSADQMIKMEKTSGSMPTFSAAYQRQVAGSTKLEPAIDIAGRSKAVKLDGIRNGKLIEAKGRYGRFLTDSGKVKRPEWKVFEGMVDQFESQLKAANKVDRELVVKFAEKDVMKVVKDKMRDRRILDKITVKHVEAK